MNNGAQPATKIVKAILLPSEPWGLPKEIDLTLYFCEKCGNYGLPSIYDPECTRCANIKRHGHP